MMTKGMTERWHSILSGIVLISIKAAESSAYHPGALKAEPSAWFLISWGSRWYGAVEVLVSVTYKLQVGGIEWLIGRRELLGRFGVADGIGKWWTVLLAGMVSDG